MCPHLLSVGRLLLTVRCSHPNANPHQAAGPLGHQGPHNTVMKRSNALLATQRLPVCCLPYGRPCFAARRVLGGHSVLVWSAAQLSGGRLCWRAATLWAGALSLRHVSDR